MPGDKGPRAYLLLVTTAAPAAAAGGAVTLVLLVIMPNNVKGPGDIGMKVYLRLFLQPKNDVQSLLLSRKNNFPARIAL